MEIPKLAVEKERENLYYVYLFYVEDNWWAFGYSAYNLSIMYPVLETDNETCLLDEVNMPCVHVPENFLTRLSDSYNTLASDNYIRVEAPPTAYCYRKEYDEWCMSLTVN